MSKLDRRKLQKLILQEFKMMGMAPMSSMGVMGMEKSGCGDDGHMDEEMLMPSHSMGHSEYGHSHKGSVSREDCCKAVMCLIECCACPVTKAALMECCGEIMAGHYDH